MSGESPKDTGDLTRRATGYGLFMLTIVYAFNFIDRQILVILQEPIKQEMGLSDAQLGLLSGFTFALVYITAGIPIAWWADRGNRRNIIALSLTVWSGMTAVSGLAQNYTHLLLARIGVGLGEAGGSPPAHSMISDYYPPERRGFAMGIYSSGLHFGVLLGLLIGGWISQYYGWRMAFFAVGLPGVLFAVVFFFTVKEPQRGRWESGDHSEHKPTLRETLGVLAGFPSFWLISIGAGLAAFIGYGSANFSPSYLMRNHGLTVGEVGTLLSLLGGGGGMAGALLGGYLADRLGKHDKRWYLWVPALAGLLAVPIGLPFLLSDNTTVVLMTIPIVVMLQNTYIGPVIAVSHALVPPAMRALTSAILFFILNLIGLGLGPLTVGLLSDAYQAHFGVDSLRFAMLTAVVLSSPSILLFFLGARRLRVDLDAKNTSADHPR